VLKQRILTASILLPIVLGLVLFAPAHVFALATALVALLGGQEWTRLGGIESRRWRSLYLLLLAVLLVGLEWLRLQTGLFWLHALAGGWWLLGLLWLLRWRKAAMGRTQGMSLPGLALGLLVLSSFWAAMVELRTLSEHGPELVLALLLLIWIADSVAYFAGRRWGTHKLAPGISPGKTLEGVYGALAGLLLFSVALFFWGLVPSVLLWQLTLLCLVTGIFSIVGDLFESLLKRRRGLKDSGYLLPGHGGVLDRIDSLLAAAPVFVLGLLWLTGV
jgi:phosphatidate cytidylyltransferase